MSERVQTLIDQIETVGAQSNQAVALGSLIFLLREELKTNSQKETTEHAPGQTPSDYDPRAPNCRFHSPDTEPVTGVWLTYHRIEGAKYWLKSVRLVDEHEAGGRHIITVLQPDGLQVALATGYSKDPDRFDAVIPHSPGQDLILDGHGKPPDLGPYAVFLMDSNGKRVSDVIASFMLPRGHHVCYVCEFVRANVL